MKNLLATFSILSLLLLACQNSGPQKAEETNTTEATEEISAEEIQAVEIETMEIESNLKKIESTAEELDSLIETL